jgi:hypothetical protein
MYENDFLSARWACARCRKTFFTQAMYDAHRPGSQHCTLVRSTGGAW